MLKNKRNYTRVHYVYELTRAGNRRIAVFGVQTLCCRRTVYLPTEFERRSFDAVSIDADASIDRGARNSQRVAIRLLQYEELDAARFSETETFCFWWRAMHFSIEIERRFFYVQSIDADASVDRGARKHSKFTVPCNPFA